jgi:hypothetical protein
VAMQIGAPKSGHDRMVAAERAAPSGTLPA